MTENDIDLERINDDIVENQLRRSARERVETTYTEMNEDESEERDLVSGKQPSFLPSGNDEDDQDLETEPTTNSRQRQTSETPLREIPSLEQQQEGLIKVKEEPMDDSEEVFGGMGNGMGDSGLDTSMRENDDNEEGDGKEDLKPEVRLSYTGESFVENDSVVEVF